MTAKERAKRAAVRLEATGPLKQGIAVPAVASAQVVYRWRRALHAGGVGGEGISRAVCRLDDAQLRQWPTN